MKKRPTRKPRVLLVDGDIVLYQQAWVNQHKWDWGDGVVSEWTTPEKAYSGVVDYIRWMKDLLWATDVIVMVTGGKNFRRELFPSYKANRKDSEKPKLMDTVVAALNENFTVISEARLEADDLLGIYSTDPKLFKGYDKIVCTIDKDLMQVPCQLFNPNRDTTYKVSQEQADRFFFQQVLQGDRIDGYAGIPGVGPKKAQGILEAALAEGTPMWDAVCQAYISNGLTIENALETARMARILRAGDYDFKTGVVKLWNPL